MTPTVIATRSDRIQRTLEHLRRQSTDTADQLVPFGPGQYTDLQVHGSKLHVPGSRQQRFTVGPGQ